MNFRVFGLTSVDPFEQRGNLIKLNFTFKNTKYEVIDFDV